MDAPFLLCQVSEAMQQAKAKGTAEVEAPLRHPPPDFVFVPLQHYAPIVRSVEHPLDSTTYHLIVFRACEN